MTSSTKNSFNKYALDIIFLSQNFMAIGWLVNM